MSANRQDLALEVATKIAELEGQKSLKQQAINELKAGIQRMRSCG